MIQSNTVTMENKPWSYSHTQLALWKLCKRRYYYKYVLGKKESTTANMAAGTWLCQEPIETWHQGRSFDDVAWETIWANFLAEFGGSRDYDDSIFNLKLAQRILRAYKANPVQGKVIEIEKSFFEDFDDGIRYQSKPDFVVERTTDRVTWDIKLKTFNQNRAGDTYYAKAPLSPFDDQCLGQAVCAKADAFGQIQFFVGKKDGLLIGPVYVEQSVSLILAAEWRLENLADIREIEMFKRSPLTYPWPKNDQACNSFSRSCPYLPNCNFGFEVKHANS